MKVHGMAGHLIRRLNQLSTHVFSTRMQEAGFGLTPVQFAAMDAIRTYPGIDQAGVASEIAYDRATIGGVIDRLEQKGYVIRTVSKRDRRAREVRLSSEGHAKYDQILPVVAAFQTEILSGLDEDERAVFVRLAEKVIREHSQTWSEGPQADRIHKSADPLTGTASPRGKRTGSQGSQKKR